MPEEIILHASIEEKQVSVHVSERAMIALGHRTLPLHVNMELYFSCFIKKMVHFSDSPSSFESSQILNNLFASFRPLQSKSCNIHDLGADSKPTLIDLPVVKRKAIVPKHLFIDCRKGKWTGNFTWNLK